jgi:hypothetical protein
MKTKLSLLGRLTLLAVLSMMPLLSQGDRGEITGTVTDASGAVVPNAYITVIQKSTNSSYKVETSSTGDFTMPALALGAYQVKVEKEGFKTHITDDLAVAPGGTTRVDVVLEVGRATQSVEVSAAAQIVQTENGKVSTTVSGFLVDSLPVLVNGASRSPFDIALSTPEVGNGNGTYHIGGGNNAFGVALDGSSMAGGKNGADQSDAATRFSPSVEALTEFNVEGSGFKAESGHASGGTITFVSKSGTNQLHGSAFEFLRNQDLDARPFTSRTTSGSRPAGRSGSPNFTTERTRRSSSARTKDSGTAPAPATVRFIACRRRRCITATLAIGWTETTSCTQSTIRIRRSW